MAEDMGNVFQDNPPGLTRLLKTSAVGIAGAGGVGSNVAALLVRAGVGRLVIADFDGVEKSNLNSQYYFSDQIGYPKVEALKHNLNLISPAAQIELHDRMIDAANACTLFEECDVLVEAVRDEDTKKLILDAWSGCFPDRKLFSCLGPSGFGSTESIWIERKENLVIVGDGEPGYSQGTLSSRIAIAAAMMANEIIAYLRTIS